MHNPSSYRKPDVQVFDIAGKVITLTRPSKAQEILERDDHRCLGCGAKSSLVITQLEESIVGLSNESFPLVLHATVCEDCRKRLKTINYEGDPTSPEHDLEFWEKFYHVDIYRAVQDLTYIYSNG